MADPRPLTKADIVRHLTALGDRAAAAFEPDAELGDTAVLFDHPNLVVHGPSADYAFLMKVEAARERDHDDLVALWPRCTFPSPKDAAVAHRAAEAEAGAAVVAAHMNATPAGAGLRPPPTAAPVGTRPGAPSKGTGGSGMAAPVQRRSGRIQ